MNHREPRFGIMTAMRHVFISLGILLVLGTAGHAEHLPPLMQDANRGHLAGVQRLLAAGADPNTKLDNGVTALYGAAYYGQADVVKLLLAAGADPNAMGNLSGIPPLYGAIRYNYVDVVKVLLEAGADPNATFSSGAGKTPLELAEHYNHTEVINLLKDAGALSRTPEQGR